MTTGEIFFQSITCGIATLALIGTVVSIYFQFIKQNAACVISCRPRTERVHGFKLYITNTGNTPVIIESIVFLHTNNSLYNGFIARSDQFDSTIKVINTAEHYKTSITFKDIDQSYENITRNAKFTKNGDIKTFEWTIVGHIEFIITNGRIFKKQVQLAKCWINSDGSSFRMDELTQCKELFNINCSNWLLKLKQKFQDSGNSTI